MAETRKSEGMLVTLENCTAASNMAAGTPVALATVTGLSTTVYSLGLDTVGVSASDLLGYHFVGILDTPVSANESPINVWVKGIFKMRLASGVTTANAWPGNPVWADSGIVVTTPGQTGDVPIGTLVERPLQLAGVTATQFTGRPFVQVKINPAVFRWTKAFDGAITATQVIPLAYPVVNTGAE